MMAIALGLTGCGPKGEEKGQPHAPPPGISFQAKHGLLVPPATAKFIGLEVADLDESKVAATLIFSAQVYRTANETPLASIHRLAAKNAQASGFVSGGQAASLREGQPVKVTVAGADVFTGYVSSVNHALAKASGQVEVLLAIEDGQARLARGAFVSVTAPLGGDQNVVSLPRSALLRTTEGDFVYTRSGERFVRTPVKLGMLNPELAEVAEGLFEGDQVVVKPVMTLWLAELQSIRGGKACADGH
jgi:multidrug efflux pump subunit AcrA (membrane-fusion protein)